LIFGSEEKFKAIYQKNPQHILARIEAPDAGFSGSLYNAISEPAFCKVILDYMENRRRLKGGGGEIVAYPTKFFAKLKQAASQPLEPQVLHGGETNTLVLFGKTFMLKVFRQLEWGTNPDLEMSRFLSERNFSHTPKLAGVAEFVRGKEAPVTLALLFEYIPNQGLAWDYTQEHLRGFLENALQAERPLREIPVWGDSLFAHLEKEPADGIKELFGTYLISVSRMGEVTAMLHRILAGEKKDPVFAPEPIDPHYQRSFFEAVKGLTVRTFRELKGELNGLPKVEQNLAKEVLGMEKSILKRMEGLIQEKIEAKRIRCHGDYQLRQLLHTGKDFIIIDFEGEPGRHWSIRKLKRSPFRDVASMLRSFHYAAQTALSSEAVQDFFSSENAPLLRQWSRLWYQWVSAAFLRSYLKECDDGDFLPKNPKAMEILLTTHMFEKCIYEISFELEYRPQFLKIPLQGILQLMGK
jgi:maltose alpha-D-glucosyltransferase/alpha-amylase